jgi:rSAM/selenodomain-associated transferase 2
MVVSCGPLAGGKDHRAAGSQTHRAATISVILPALNEADNLRGTLESLRTDPESEIIVVDGGSRDDTRSIARCEGVTALSAPPGRARQQNLGAAAASGEILFFLHADTRAPRQYADLIREALKLPGVSAGAFSLAIAGDQPGLQAITAMANIRSRWLQMPYGDQGLFLPARLFTRLGGFPEQPIMEDYVLVRRLRRHGRIITLPETVSTSGRRWRQVGIWRTTAINQLMIVGHHLGVAPATLARLYRRTC